MKHPDRPPEAPYLGVGIGLRTRHYAEILESDAASQLGIRFFEAISENFMVPGGTPLRILGQVRERFPVVLHGVSMNLGSTDALDAAYLRALRALCDRIEARWISDHLCWTGVGGHNLHDLLPLPFDEATLVHVADRVRRAQDALGRRIAIENVSSYLEFERNAMPEWEFLVRVAERADCGILLDVNNVFVNANNHGLDAVRYLDAIPPERVFQVHLAGHSVQGDLLIDTHDHPVRHEVWRLFERFIERAGPVSTLIEWDDRIPPLAAVAREAGRARAVIESVVGKESNGSGRIARSAAAGPMAVHHRA